MTSNATGHRRSLKSIEILDGLTPGLMAEVCQLLLDYAGSLGAELSIQDVRHEARDLPGLYAAPRGCYLIARDRYDGAILGGVGLRALPGPGDCEVKRLHVRPAGGGIGLGQLLGAEVISRARAMGYRRVVLEAHGSMASALRIYRKLGFEQIPLYYANPLPGTIYLGLLLDQHEGRPADAPDGEAGTNAARASGGAGENALRRDAAGRSAAGGNAADRDAAGKLGPERGPFEHDTADRDPADAAGRDVSDRTRAGDAAGRVAPDHAPARDAPGGDAAGPPPSGRDEG